MINIKLPFQAYGVNSSISSWGKKKFLVETFHIYYFLELFVLGNLPINRFTSFQVVIQYDVLVNPELFEFMVQSLLKLSFIHGCINQTQTTNPNFSVTSYLNNHLVLS